MTKFEGGPAAGVTLDLCRSPKFLRVVRLEPLAASDSSVWDALDQLSDRPRPGETVYVYRKVSDDSAVHICGIDKAGKRFGRWLTMATYAVVEPQPEQATLRDSEKWREWAMGQAATPAPSADAGPETGEGRHAQ